MAQAAVETKGWLTAKEMIDGLALAETTPGPLILVTQFVGYFAGYHVLGSAWGGRDRFRHCGGGLGNGRKLSIAVKGALA